MVVPLLCARMLFVPVTSIVPVLFRVPVRLKFPLLVAIERVPELLNDPVPKLMAPPLHSLPLPSAEIEPLPLIVPLASVKSPEADASLIVSVLLTVSVPSQVLSMSRAPTVFATSTIAVPYSLSVDVKSAVSDAPGTPADQLPALLQLSFPPDLAECGPVVRRKQRPVFQVLDRRAEEQFSRAPGAAAATRTM